MNEQVQSEWTNSPEEPSGEKDRSLQVAAGGCIENFKGSFSRNSGLVPFILQILPWPLLALQAGLQELMYQWRCVSWRNCYRAMVS